MKKTLRLVTITTMLAGALFTASAPVTAADAVNKRIYIGSPSQRQPLQVSFNPTKSSFAVGEPITFTIKGNKKFFLFLFNIDHANNKAYMILPNEIQTANRNMYLANQKLRVPNANVEFYSDRPGYERIVMLATTKYPTEIVLNKYKRAGKFYITEAKTVQEQLKRIQVRGNQIRRSTTEEVYIKEFDLPIVGNSTASVSVPSSTTYIIQTTQPATVTSAPVNNQPRDYSIRLIMPGQAANSAVPTPGATAAIAYLSTDRFSYRSGERMFISFGASQDGYVSLYTKNGNQYELLTEQAVKANIMNTVEGYAGRKGKQQILSVFSKKQGYKASSAELKALATPELSQSKGFQIVADAPAPATTPAVTLAGNNTAQATAVVNFQVY